MMIKTTLLKLVPVAGLSAGRGFRTVAGACILSFLLVGAGTAETTTSDEDTVTATDCKDKFNEYTDTNLHDCTISEVSVTASGQCSIDATCKHHVSGNTVDNSVTIALDKISLLIACPNGKMVKSPEPYPGISTVCIGNVN